MNRRIMSLLVIALVLASTEAWSADVQVLKLGTYHGDEIKADIKGSWWAVCPEAAGKQDLKSVTVSTVRVQDPVLDTGAQKTGIEIKALGCKEPALLVRGLNLSVGTLTVGSVADLQSPDGMKSKSVSVAYQGQNWTIEETKIGESGYRLTLKGSAGTQSIFETPNANEEGRLWDVIWVGDLDRDQKPDFFINASDHYNVKVYRLLLSGAAKPQQSVGEIAVLKATGC